METYLRVSKVRKNARAKCRTKSSTERGVYKTEKLTYTSPKNT